MKTDTQLLDFVQSNKARISAVYSDQWVVYTGMVEEHGKSVREAITRAIDRTEKIVNKKLP
jgi:hypothetical protein